MNNIATHPASGRGLRRAFMDGSTDLGAVNAAIGGLQTAFAAFKAANDERLAAIEKGRGDVLNEEKVNRINNAVTEMQTTVDQQAQQLAALRLSGGGGGAQPQNREYSTAFNRFFRRGDTSALDALNVNNAASTGDEADGGFTVPVEIETTIDRVLAKTSAIRSLATVRQISSSLYRKPVSKGGATSGWVGETSDRDKTEGAKLSVIDFPTMELYAQPAATQGLLDDSAIDIGAWLADEVNITFAEQEGLAFWSGDGVKMPSGIASYGTVDDSTYSVAGNWGKLGYVATGVAGGFAADSPTDTLISLAYALKQGYRQNATWLMNRKTQGTIRKFKDANGDYIWQPSVVAGQPSTLLGYPVADDDNIADVAAGAYPVAFGDFKRGYLIVDRVGIRVLRDNLTQKPYVLFYTTKRVGGGVQNFEAIKLLKVAAK